MMTKGGKFVNGEERVESRELTVESGRRTVVSSWLVARGP